MSASAGLALPAAVRQRFREPPRKVEDLDEPNTRLDHALRVSGARVVFADEDLLVADFPGVPRESLEDWLLQHAAVISVTQAEQEWANTPIPTVGEPFPVYRLPCGGRAFYVECGPGDGPGRGLLALKGTGVAPGVEPRRCGGGNTHCDGLLGLDGALEEFTQQRLIETIFEHMGEEWPRCLPTYALVDLGFDVVRHEGVRRPAAMMVRRSHKRQPDGRELPMFGSANQAAFLEICLRLRRYGVDATVLFELRRDGEGQLTCFIDETERKGWPQDGMELLWKAYASEIAPDQQSLFFSGVNVQATRADSVEDVELVDFGTFWVREEFEHSLLSLVHNRSGKWGGVVRRDNPRFVQPDPALAIPARYWARSGDAADLVEEGLMGASFVERHRELASQESWAPLQFLCRYLAQGFRSGELDGSRVLSTLESFIGLVTAHWDRRA